MIFSISGFMLTTYFLLKFMRCWLYLLICPTVVWYNFHIKL
nr:MAG TPA: hypothetical protein [Caudoviricetes sp.]